MRGKDRSPGLPSFGREGSEEVGAHRDLAARGHLLVAPTIRGGLLGEQVVQPGESRRSSPRDGSKIDWTLADDCHPPRQRPPMTGGSLWRC